MKALPIVAAVAFAAVTLTVGVRAGGEKVAFPETYGKGVLYTTVDRADNKQYRELYATPEAIAAVKAGQPMPSGSVLTLMEKRTGWGSEYPDELRNGEWEYQAFKADKTVNDKANLKNCFTCHKPLDKQDFVFSFDKMKTAK